MNPIALAFLIPVGIAIYILGGWCCGYYAVRFWGRRYDGSVQFVAFFNFFLWPVLWPFLLLHVLISKGLSS